MKKHARAVLCCFDLVYLATPYSRYPGGIEAGFQAAARLAGKLLAEGVKVYSPIAHTHPLAIYAELDPLDHAIWIPFDESMMRASQALVVAQMPTWEQSKGIALEIEFFYAARKRIFMLDPQSLEVW